MTIAVGNAQYLAMLAMADALEPPPPIDYRAWAKGNIAFSDRESPGYPGPYNDDTFCEFNEILAALGPDDPCRTVTLAKSAQMGGTVVANVFILGTMDVAPGDVMVVHPTADNAVRWSKMKLTPMLKSTTALTRIFPQKARDGSDSILFKERVDGRGAILISGANSPASLSQVSVSRQVQDDLSKWEMNQAGDPEKQADSRSRASEFAKIFKVSTPLIMPGCRITRSFREGSQERPYVPCLECGEHQVLEWTNMLATIEADPEDPHFTCIHCGCEIREHQLREMKRRLEWRADNLKVKPFHRSFWLWSAYSVLQSWSRIAREWLDAKGDPSKERVFFNDTVGLAYEALGDAPDWEKLRDRAAESHYHRGEIPAGGLIVTLGVDCQIDYVQWQAVAWGREHRRWIIDSGTFPGHIAEQKCQDALDALLKQTWPNAHGHRLAADMLAIDGNAWTEDVWSFARRHPASRVMMVRGVGADTAPLLARVKRERNRDGKLLKYTRRFYNFATSILKMALYRNLAKTDALERSHVGLPKGLDDDFWRQLTAERRVPVLRRGFTVYQWEKDPNQANEGLDTHLQAEAAAIKLGVRGFMDAQWDRLEAEREIAPPVQGQLDIEDLPLLRTQFAAPDPAPPSPPPADPTSGPQVIPQSRSAAPRRRRLA